MEKKGVFKKSKKKKSQINKIRWDMGEKNKPTKKGLKKKERKNWRIKIIFKKIRTEHELILKKNWKSKQKIEKKCWNSLFRMCIIKTPLRKKKEENLCMFCIENWREINKQCSYIKEDFFYWNTRKWIVYNKGKFGVNLIKFSLN